MRSVARALRERAADYKREMESTQASRHVFKLNGDNSSLYAEASSWRGAAEQSDVCCGARARGCGGDGHGGHL